MAARLGVSQATVARAVARGLLRPALITPGGHRRFNSADVEVYAASLQDEPEGARLITTGEAARLLGVSSRPSTARYAEAGCGRPSPLPAATGASTAPS